MECMCPDAHLKFRYNRPMTRFAETLKTLRSNAGLSLRNLSDAVGISTNNLSCYENKLVVPTLEMVVKLAKYFDVSVDYFVHGESLTEEIRDKELRTLFTRIDAIVRKDRELVKRYLKTVLRNREEREELEKKADTG